LVQFAETDKIAYRYGLDELPVDITNRELLYFFTFGNKEKSFIRKKSRLPSYQLVIAIHLGAYRLIGRPQAYPEKTPLTIIRFVSNTLNLRDGFVPLEYSDRERTRREHAQITRQYLGLSHFTIDKHQSLIEHLIHQSPDPGHLPEWIKNAEDFLRANQFVLPSVKVLRRLILSIRRQSLKRVASSINSQLGSERKKGLQSMLKSQGESVPLWNSITDKNIYSATPKKISKVLKHIKSIREVALKDMDLSHIPYSHIQHLAQQGAHLTAKRLRVYKAQRRYATMAATLLEFESELTDVAIQMNDEILAGVFQRGEKRSEKYLRKYRRVVQRVISAFRFMSGVILSENLSSHLVVEHITQKIPLGRLQALREETDIINIPRGSEKLYFASQGCSTIQKYLPAFLDTFKIVSFSPKDPVLKAVYYYSEKRRQGISGIGPDAPTGFVQEAKWKRIVFDKDGRIKTKPWVLCFADRLRRSFLQGSLEIEGARQYRSLNSDLIPWSEWNAIEIKENEELPFSFPAEKAVTTLFCAIKDLSGQFKQWLDEEVPPATIDKKNRLHLTKLDKQIVPESAEELKRILRKRMPRASLSDIFAEVDELTGYSAFFTRLSSGLSIQQDEKSASQSFYALLLAAACNIPLVQIAVRPGLDVSILETLREDIIRPQTLQSAMAALVDFYSRLPLTQL
jgi:hypothetical protein